MLETFPPNMLFRLDLIGVRLASWNTLSNYHMGHDEFRSNLHVNGKFSVKSIYKALFYSDVTFIGNNKKSEDESAT
jgi:hypothetical protein